MPHPFGDDFFKINHGADYFAFFKRLGQLHYYVVLDNKKVITVVAGILRRAPEKTWYLCDLKIHPDYRGQHLPLRILKRCFLPNYLRCQRAYAISMNPSDGSTNRVLKLLNHFRYAPISYAHTLNIYMLNFQEINNHKILLESHLGPISFLNLAGIKDLILEKAKYKMPLLHLQHGLCAQADSPEPHRQALHMFCTVHESSLADALQKLNILPAATATILHHRMGHVDWSFVLTSDI